MWTHIRKVSKRRHDECWAYPSFRAYTRRTFAHTYRPDGLGPLARHIKERKITGTPSKKHT